MEEKSTPNSKELEKEKRRKKELKKLNKIFEKIDENKQKVVKKLIESASFLTIELEDLEKEIAIEGVVEDYQNGQYQSGKKKSSKVDVYNNFIKNYTSIIKQLCELIPEDELPSNTVGNAVFKFITQPKPTKK